MKKPCQILWIFFLLLNNGLIAQNAPVSAAGTVSTVASSATISITVADFNNISSCNLVLLYDSTIATATAVVVGPLPGGNLNTDLSVPGKISLGWYTYPALTLPGDPVLFNITFSKVATGTTEITWFDDGSSCIWYDGSYNPLHDIPTSSYYLNGALTFLPPVAPVITIPALSACAGENIDVPVTVAGFNDVGKFNLAMNYGSLSLQYQSFTSGGFPGLIVDGSLPGTIVVSGVVEGLSGITLPDSTILFTLHFIFSGGSTLLSWSDNGPSCEFYGPPPDYIVLSDLPLNSHYIDGQVTQLSLPAMAGAITGPAGGYVLRGQTGVTFYISPVPDATGYTWMLPAGLTMTGGDNTNTISVSVGYTFVSGVLTVMGYNSCGNGATSPEFQVTDTTALGFPYQEEPGNGGGPGLMLKSFPNPFSGNVTLTWFVPVKGEVLLEIMNMQGESIATLIDQVEDVGSHCIQVSSASLLPGSYIVRMALKSESKLMIRSIKIVRSE